MPQSYADLRKTLQARSAQQQQHLPLRRVKKAPKKSMGRWFVNRVRGQQLRRAGAVAAFVGLLAVVFAGCGRGQTPIPPGAQVVHIVLTESEVHIDPATVRSGDVYLVLDAPLDGGFNFVERQRSADETPGPLSDDDLERLAHGDTEGTSIGGHSSGCSASQRAEDRGLMGPCGNVMMATLRPGKYAILGPGWTEQETEPSLDPTADPAGFVAPPTMAVLEVVP
jgi:hypothetical protein